MIVPVVEIAVSRELARLVAAAPWPVCPEISWRLHPVASIAAGVAALGRRVVAIVVCDADQHPDWARTLLPACTGMGTPRLVLSSRLADERFWAEALNLGAYDVLARPYAADEVGRVLRHAWTGWDRERRMLGATA